LVGRALSDVVAAYPKLARPRMIHETVRRMIGNMVNDVITTSERNIRRLKPQSVTDVRMSGEVIVTFSSQMRENNRVLKSFLTKHMYRSPAVLEVMARAQRLIRDLFIAYTNDEKLLTGSSDQKKRGRGDKHREVCDFIAGMTDRYAIAQHRRLFDLDPLFS
jgi:dGTPase